MTKQTKPKRQRKARAKPQEAPKIGRPTLYTAELADYILDEMRSGRTLTSICAPEGMPSDRTVRKWADDIEEFSPLYARAREHQAHAFFEATIDIADDGSRDYVETEENGRKVLKVDHDHIQRSKLRVETRKWAAAKLLPKTYGDKLDLNVSQPMDQMTEDQLLERARAQAAGLRALGIDVGSVH